MNWLISALLSFLKLIFTTPQLTMMPQSNGGEVGKDHEDDSDSKATFSLGSNLITSCWFGVSATLALFSFPIIFLSVYNTSALLERQKYGCRKVIEK